jgi:hypothetical protein
MLYHKKSGNPGTEILSFFKQTITEEVKAASNSTNSTELVPEKATEEGTEAVPEKVPEKVWCRFAEDSYSQSGFQVSLEMGYFFGEPNG